MPRRRKDDTPLASETWDAFRREHDMPESKRIRQRGLCFDCGEVIRIGPCGGWHSRMEGMYGRGITVEVCCACVGDG